MNDLFMFNKVDGVSPVGGSKPAGSSKLPDVKGVDFARILEELTAAAGKLGEASKTVDAEDPQALKDAVSQAKQSLDTALSAGESLLEAYRRTAIVNPDSKNE